MYIRKLSPFWALHLFSVLLRLAGVASLFFYCGVFLNPVVFYVSMGVNPPNVLLNFATTLVAAVFTSVGLFASGQFIVLMLSLEQSLKVLRVLALRTNRQREEDPS